MSGSGSSSMEYPGDCYTMHDSQYFHPDLEREAENVYLTLDDVLEKDDSEKFLTLTDSREWWNLPPGQVRWIGLSVLDNTAVQCAELVLSGLMKGVIDQHFGFSPDGWTALHEACLSFDHPMLEKLILCGDFDPNIRGDKRNKFIQALPLNVGLRTVRFLSDTCEPSAFSLLHYLYTKLNLCLDSTRLLALNTRDFHQEFYNYAKQGKMVEVAALLLASGDNLLPLCISEGGDKHKFNSFKQISDFLQDNKNRWSSTTSNDDHEFAEWKETLKLLNIYDKIGYQLTAFVGLKNSRRSGMEVQDLLKAHCFDVESGDNNLHNYVHVQRSNKLKALHSSIENSGMENSGMKESGMEKARDFDVRIDSNHKRYYVPVDRSNDQSFKPWPRLKNGEFENLPKLNIMNPLIMMNHKPNSLVGVVAKGLHGGSKSNYSTSAANITPMKWFNAIQNHNSNNSWVPFMRILSKKVRRV